MIRKPRIIKEMKTFLGCGIGDLRLETLKNLYPGSMYEKLVKAGLIMIVPSPDPARYIGLAITEAGKKYVQPLESYYARL